MKLCLNYYAKVNKDGWPIPGTLRGIAGTPCTSENLVLIPPVDTPLGVINGHTYAQCFHPQGLRFFVHVGCDGLVIPNSLIITKKHPGGQVAEFKRTYIVS